MKIGTVEFELFDKKDAYNNAANNERMIELPLAEWFLKKHNYFKSIIEVGAVTPYYFESQHFVFDPFDTHKRCIKVKAQDVNYLDCILLSISTIEHICSAGDYNVPIETDKTALDVLQNMMKAKEYLITFPRRFNRILDDFVEQKKENVIKLKRTNIKAWEKTESLVNMYLNIPYLGGNGL